MKYHHCPFSKEFKSKRFYQYALLKYSSNLIYTYPRYAEYAERYLVQSLHDQNPFSYRMTIMNRYMINNHQKYILRQSTKLELFKVSGKKTDRLIKSASIAKIRWLVHVGISYAYFCITRLSINNQHQVIQSNNIAIIQYFGSLTEQNDFEEQVISLQLDCLV